MTITRAYLCLSVLLGLTFLVSFAELGLLNDVLAWGLAALKALIILFVFMHYRRELESSRIYFLLGLFMSVLLLVGMLDDVLFRS